MVYEPEPSFMVSPTTTAATGGLSTGCTLPNYATPPHGRLVQVIRGSRKPLLVFAVTRGVLFVLASRAGPPEGSRQGRGRSAGAMAHAGPRGATTSRARAPPGASRSRRGEGARR